MTDTSRSGVALRNARVDFYEAIRIIKNADNRILHGKQSVTQCDQPPGQLGESFAMSTFSKGRHSIIADNRRGCYSDVLGQRVPPIPPGAYVPRCRGSDGQT